MTTSPFSKKMKEMLKTAQLYKQRARIQLDIFSPLFELLEHDDIIDTFQTKDLKTIFCFKLDKQRIKELIDRIREMRIESTMPEWQKQDTFDTDIGRLEEIETFIDSEEELLLFIEI